MEAWPFHRMPHPRGCTAHPLWSLVKRSGSSPVFGPHAIQPEPEHTTSFCGRDA